MTFEILTTERLLLRKTTEEVFEFVYDNYSDEELIEFLGVADLNQLEIERGKFKNGFSTFNKTFLYFHILDKTTEKIIGWCGYHTWYLDHNRAEIGYGLFSENYKNTGIMTEAMKAVLDYGFDQMHLHRVEAMIATYNVPSLKLVEKFGFTKEGILREHYSVNGKMEDSVVFSLLKQEHRR